MNYIKQVIFEMRHQKMMTWVSIAGTMVAIFLVMTFFMVDQIKIVDVAPESHRSRMLYGGGIHFQKSSGADANSSLSYKMAERLYGNLEGIEAESYAYAWPEWQVNYTIGIGEKITRPVYTQVTDGNFWKIYDFKFISGKPYTEDDCHADTKKIVMSRGLARAVFSKEDVAGEMVYLNSAPYIISGVVEDVHPSMGATFGNIYRPFSQEDYDYEKTDWGYPGMGNLMVHLKMKPGVKREDITAQVRERYVKLNAEVAKDSLEAIYHEGPHDAEVYATGWAFSNQTPEDALKGEKQKKMAIYAILLLIPAINLGSMIRGRLRHRVSEIGVKRAFGARRSDILRQILGENLIITLVGGVIGMILSILFVMFVSSSFFDTINVDASSLKYSSTTLEVGMLFTWENFAVAIIVCFVLNLVSAFLPAWKASCVQPAEAISKSKM